MPTPALPPETLARFDTEGPGSLSDAELLALGLGLSLDVATSVLSEFGGLFAVTRASPQDLGTALGGKEALLRRVAASRELGLRMLAAPDVRPKLNKPNTVAEYLGPRIAHLPYEVFHVLCFNARNVLIRDVRVARGTVSSCAVSPRDVFAPALGTSGTVAVILAHNHPSGDPEPSAQDLALTRYLCKAAALLNVKVLDHVVIGGKGHVSLAERGMFPDSVE
ncbi:JAB domain-containing protein [Pyxidicoccus sp. MSG2]|uniref:JAB domain-containing protein n=1 Tax=Pyxidicoccus sp. MSG2 TaxID=2996790 RepID=UPI00226EE3DB|nr:DNA repair protein RadC [Pyxidicoccus sp. MSG2]MCY1024057.1 DNA repair protein RadC [Pyxidicoccus sp. MSG2]